MFAHGSIVPMVIAQTTAFVASWAFAYAAGHRLRVGHWTVSLAWIGLLQAGAFAVAERWTGFTPGPVEWVPVAVAAVLVVSLLEDWNAFGHACLATTLTLSGTFLVYLVTVVAGTRPGPLTLVLSLILMLLQFFALVLLCAGSYEILDVLCRIRWRRIAEPRPLEGDAPRVSLHVPAYNEPPDMVIETLDALARLDYPNYEVVVVDDNTTDESLWRPVEAHCAKLGFKFFHLENWPGFKSGALNFALTRTDPATEIVGVVDSDYVVEPDYLARCVGFFRDESVAFVQTPQDYRDIAEGDRYAQACYDAYLYFFRISMASRNEHNGIIFAGTMGLIRRPVLEQLGGWDEWCITEDAEISLRMLDRGHRGVFVEQSFGRGLMPLNFEGLKKQRFRWAFGGMQILRRHWRALMPWARWRDPSHRLTFAQQWDYLLGGLQWLNDPVTFAFTMILLVGSASLVFARSLFLQPLAPAVLIVPFLFVFIGVTRFLWALRVRLRCGMRRAVRAFAILLGLTWVVTLACTLGLVSREGVFLRTPKKHGPIDRWHPLRIVTQESALFLMCLAAVAGLLATQAPSAHISVMIGLLGWQSLIYLSAAACSFAGHRSELRAAHPEYLRSTRTTGERFTRMSTGRVASWALAGLVAMGLIVYALAVRFAPESERAYRAPGRVAGLIPAAMVQPSDEGQIKADLYFEKEAALRGDADRAMRLWAPDGVVRDANYTVSDPSDDRVWVGHDQVRRRYVEEFARHHYLELRHSDASVFIQGDTAVIVNDLRATIRTPSGIQHVFLSRGDRWTFVKGKDGWKIVELVLNRAPR